MPALPSPGDIIRAGFRFGLATGEASGRVALHFAYTGGPPSLVAGTAIANALFSAAQTRFQPLMSNVVTGDQFQVTDLSSPTGIDTFSSGTIYTGTRSGTGVSDEIAVNTVYEVSRRYRGGRPRSFWPFGTQSDFLSQRQWSGAFLAAVDAGVQGFVSDALAVSSGGVALSEWVNVSYFKGFTVFMEPSGRARNIPTVRATPVVDALTYGFSNSVISSQRRRRGKPV